MDSLPDNAFAISSSSSSASWVSFHLFTVLGSIGFYLGPWIFAPFVILALSFSFLYAKRDSGWDLFAAPLVLAFCAGVSFYLAPEFMGKGIVYVLKTYATPFSILTTMFLAFMGFSFLTFRKTFFWSLQKSFMSFIHAPEILWRFLTNLNLVDRYSRMRETMKSKFAFLSKSATKLMRGEEKANSTLPQTKNHVRPVQSKPIKAETIIVAAGPEQTEQDFEEIFPVDAAGTIEDVEFTDETNTESPVKISSFRAKAKISSVDSQYHDIMTHFADKPRQSQVRQPEDDYFSDIIAKIEGKLGEFNITGQIINILKGPVVDTFELELGSGVKVSKINSVQEDLSLALYGAPIRVVYPMKERTTVGIEVPRNPRDVIILHEVLQTEEYTNSKNRLPVAMGKNAFGETFVVDLAAMPHMLVAGATGAGKSVFINTLLVSLLVKKSPRQMKLILIDPKQLELALYSRLPHLIMPVITEPKKAAISLLWAVQEMERRYSVLKEFGVRDIENFNRKVQTAHPEMMSKIHSFYENEPDEEGYELPYIVVIVDEFADLILNKVGKEIENYICRLAAKARACGIHLVLATQRPSVDVVTGLIKSNFPVRVSFRVTTNADSRTILDSPGAEKLLGKGDMLYRHGVDTMRVHSSYVDESEIETLVDRLADLSGNFHPGAMDFLENGGEDSSGDYSFGGSSGGGDFGSGGGGEGDELFQEAVKVVVESRAASASMLQRRLRIGYNRAANLIDELENKGVVGPAQGSKPRQVLGGESVP